MAVTAMSDLTDFLFARIQEDAADATNIRRWIVDEEFPRGAYEFRSKRVSAECEAKWKIVEDAVDVLDPPFGRFGNWFVRFWLKGQVTHTLRLLAIPYADHPDYQEGWRPEYRSA